jgi:magnesium transporter
VLGALDGNGLQMKAHKYKTHTHAPQTRKPRSRRRRTPPGAPPGTLLADPNSPHPTIRILAYGPDDLIEQEVNNPQQVRNFLDKWPVLWVDVEGLGHAETISELGEIFAIHRLALEDVLNVHQRPKVEPYGDYHFIVTRMARFNGRVETEQLTLFLGENFVLTFQEGQPGDCLEMIRERIRQRRGRIREAGLDYLAYALLDAVVDGYFPILEEYGERLETLEDEIVTQPSSDTVARIHEIRRDLLTVRRAMWPQREMFNALLREELEMVTNETRLYLRDCYDHTTQIIDLVETYRELGADLTDVYLSSISNRTNEIMRVLTVIATIFIPLTFIAGVYGMNFNTSASPLNMPELNWFLGYPLVLLLMFGIAIGQLAFFRTRGWLGAPKAARRVGGGERDTLGS